jgi:hypothetical protein
MVWEGALGFPSYPSTFFDLLRIQSLGKTDSFGHIICLLYKRISIG